MMCSCNETISIQRPFRSVVHDICTLRPYMFGSREALYSQKPTVTEFLYHKAHSLQSETRLKQQTAAIKVSSNGPRLTEQGRDIWQDLDNYKLQVYTDAIYQGRHTFGRNHEHRCLVALWVLQYATLKLASCDLEPWGLEGKPPWRYHALTRHYLTTSSRQVLCQSLRL